MKMWVALGFVFLLLLGVASVLLRTEQAPLQIANPVEDTAPPPPSPPVVDKPQSLTTEEFRTLGAEVMRSLPSKGKKDKSLPILVAGESLEAVNEAVRNEPTLAGEALLLYQGCMNSGQYSDSVRALCYINFKNLSQQTGKAVSRKSAPPHIRALADQLED